MKLLPYFILLPGPLLAASITWQAAQNTTNKSNLIEGNIQQLLNGGSAITVANAGGSGTSSFSFAASQYSTLTFAPTVTSNLITNASNGAASTGDSSFDTLLDTFSYTTSGTTSGTQTISGLSIGKTYQIQIFYNDQRSCCSGRTMTYGDSSNTVNISAGGSGHGQYAIGTFTADATTQILTHQSNGFANIHYNAILVVEASSIPVASLTTASSTTSGSFGVDVTFTESITGLSESDFLVTNGTVENASLTGSDASWSLTIVPTANGDVTITLPANSVTDTDGDNNQNPSSNVLTTTYITPGSDQPVPTLGTANPLVTGPYTATISFTENVTGLTIGDFSVTNATLSNLTGSGASYTLLITPDGTGEITLQLPKNTVTDTDGDNLQNSASNSLITSYSDPLTVSLYGPNNTSARDFDVHLSFSEAINGFDITDFQTSNATVLTITEQGRREFAKKYYRISLRADAPGQIRVSIPAGSVTSDANPALTNLASAIYTTNCTSDFPTLWTIDDQTSWTAHQKNASNITITDGFVNPTTNTAQFSSTTKTFPVKRKARSLTLTQSPVWDNWTDVSNVGPSGAGDAPILLPVSDNNYYFLGRGSSGGYHAWHSTDMVNWTHRGAITTATHRWVTSAEYKDGSYYIYVDHPNDHTPHVYVDNNLDDGIIGTFMGMAFNDPTNGSDCSVFRDNSDGRFHIIHEDWTPIKASTHAWDSPLAGHTSSEDGITGFEPAEHVPPIDQRTTFTGNFGTYNHPHVAGTHISNPVTYEIHSPEQNAYGDWTTIKIGDRYYLFGDYEPDHGGTIRCARFTSDSIYGEFDLVGELGSGHPDPTVGFAEGQFYLIRQQSTDHVSPGPWVDGVEARAGVDTDGNGSIDQWTAWQDVSESYSHTPGYARVVTTTPARLDLSTLPAGFGFEFEFRIDNTIVPAVSPIMDRAVMTFEPTHFQKWANDENTPAQIDADHNNNQIPNLIEFATGLTDLSPLCPFENNLTFTLSNQAQEDGYTLILEFTSDLINWTPATSATTPIKLLTSSPLPNGDLELEYELDDTIESKLFWRLKMH